MVLDFRLVLPEVLQESSWFSSCILLIQGYLLARGIQAVYQDVTRGRHLPRVPAPVPPEPQPAPVPPVPSPRVVPPVPPPEADPPAPRPAPEEVPEATPAVLRVHHHHTRVVPPDDIFRTTEGQSYHLFRDCQYIRSMAHIKTNQLCSRCQQKHQRIQQARG